VLLVDAQLGRLATLTVLLRSRCAIISASDAIDAMEIVKRWKPKIVAVDLGLPNLAGLYLLKHVRIVRPQSTVVVFTANAGPELVGDVQATATSDMFFVESDIAETALRMLRLAGFRPGRFGRHAAVAANWLAAHYPDHHINITLIADAVGTSPSSLNREFRKYFDLSVRNYLIRLRVAASEHLLATTDEKLDSIADRVWLATASHMSRWFVALLGLRPGVYRRRRLNEAPSPLAWHAFQRRAGH